MNIRCGHCGNQETNASERVLQSGTQLRWRVVCAKCKQATYHEDSPEVELIRILRKKCEWLDGYAAAIKCSALEHQATDIRRILNLYERGELHVNSPK